MARRLEAWLRKPDGCGPGAETWLRGQVAYDLWQAEHSGREMEVEPAHAVSVEKSTQGVVGASGE